MLDEIVLEIYHQRYIGHVWAEPNAPPVGSHPALRWHFSSHGRFVAEFPALPTDTRETVRTRLQTTLDRILRGTGSHSVRAPGHEVRASSGSEVAGMKKDTAAPG